MLTLLHRQLEVRIDNDRSFKFGSVDNASSYDHSYRLDEEPYLPSTLHTVTVIQVDGVVISSCILGSTGGVSEVHAHSAIIHSDSLLIAVGAFIASLQLPSLKLNWKVKTDWATCFGVYHSKENHCYISHGEIDVATVSYDGMILWSKSGADIFTNGFSVSQTEITAFDTGMKIGTAGTFEPVDYLKRRERSGEPERRIGQALKSMVLGCRKCSPLMRLGHPACRTSTRFR